MPFGINIPNPLDIVKNTFRSAGRTAKGGLDEVTGALDDKNKLDPEREARLKGLSGDFQSAGQDFGNFETPSAEREGLGPEDSRFTNAQSSLMDFFGRQARGEGSSLAEMQARKQAASARQFALAQGATGTTGGGGQARQANRQLGNIESGLANTVAQAGIQERLGAGGMAAQIAGQARGQGLQGLIAELQGQIGQRGQDLSTQLGAQGLRQSGLLGALGGESNLLTGLRGQDLGLESGMDKFFRGAQTAGSIIFG